MTENFIDILNQRDSLSMQMNAVFIISFILMCIIAYKSKTIATPLIINFFLTIIAMFVAAEVFEIWWKSVYDVAESNEDKRWIADHDGGSIMVYVIILFKGGLAYLLSFIGRLFRKKIKSKV